VTLNDFVLIEELAIQKRESVPERVMDTKGSASGKLLESYHGVDN
jgi:catalase